MFAFLALTVSIKEEIVYGCVRSNQKTWHLFWSFEVCPVSGTLSLRHYFVLFLYVSFVHLPSLSHLSVYKIDDYQIFAVLREGNFKVGKIISCYFCVFPLFISPLWANMVFIKLMIMKCRLHCVKINSKMEKNNAKSLPFICRSRFIAPYTETRIKRRRLSPSL